MCVSVCVCVRACVRHSAFVCTCEDLKMLLMTTQKTFTVK